MHENIYELINEKLNKNAIEYTLEPFRGEDGLFHFLYVVINKIDDRFYIGIHSAKTLRDSYRGSGKVLKRAVKKYGFANFTINRYAFFKNRQLLSKAEGAVVTLDLLEQYQGVIYNLRTGGDYEFFDPKQGERVRHHWNSNDEIGQAMRRGFEKARAQHDEYINSEKGLAERKAASEHMKQLWQNPEWRAKMEQKKAASREKLMQEDPEFLKRNSEKARLINMKPVAQSLEPFGEPVKVWDCQKYIPKDIISQSLLTKALKDGKVANGYYWYYFREEDRIYKPLEKDLAKAEKTLSTLQPYAITEQQAQELVSSVYVTRTYDGEPEMYFRNTNVVVKAFGVTNFPQGYLDTISLHKGLFWRRVHPEDPLELLQRQTLKTIQDYKEHRVDQWNEFRNSMGNRHRPNKVEMLKELNGEPIETFESASHVAFVLNKTAGCMSSKVRRLELRYGGFYWRFENRPS